MCSNSSRTASTLKNLKNNCLQQFSDDLKPTGRRVFLRHFPPRGSLCIIQYKNAWFCIKPRKNRHLKKLPQPLPDITLTDSTDCIENQFFHAIRAGGRECAWKPPNPPPSFFAIKKRSSEQIRRPLINLNLAGWQALRRRGCSKHLIKSSSLYDR